MSKLHTSAFAEIQAIAENAAELAAYNAVITLVHWLDQKGHTALAAEMLDTFIEEEPDTAEAGDAAENAEQHQ